MTYPKTLAEEIYLVVQGNADRPAIEALGANAVSYRELWHLASTYAKEAEACPGQIAVCLPRGVDYVAALLGCWIAGRAPVILDPEWPRGRRETIIEEASITLVFDKPRALSEAAAVPKQVPPEACAYIIYSSGSTGRPKGVIVSHAGLAPMLRQQVTAFRMDTQTRSLWMHGVAFDATISDLGTALLAGATLCLNPVGLKSDPSQFLRSIGEHEVTHIDIPPALLALLDANEAPSCLQSLVIGGSVCPPEQVRAWAAKVHLVNVYGPTEATICTSMCTCSTDWREPLIGDAIEGIFYEISPPEEGELIIMGPGVALGYLANDDLTTAKFATTEGERVFRSGDLVRRLEDGEIMFLGRIDRQFKRDGKLICPEEIESALLSHPALRESHVGLQDDTLCTWFSVHHAISTEALTLYLADLLPRWMIPTRWVELPMLPALSNGKVDIASLQTDLPLQTGHPLSGEPLEDLLTQHIRDILSNPAVAPEDDFFESGGDSLAAMQFLARTAKAGILLTPDTLCRHRTAAQMAKHHFEAGGYERSSAELDSYVENAAKGLIAPNLQADPPESEQHIFLTGASGFLGSAVLGELLTRTEASITCLVRGDIGNKQLHIREQLRQHGYSPPGERVCFVKGDLEEQNFGLGEERWRDLTNKCTHLVHCGASVHSLEPYESLQRVNVGGTTTAINFQHCGRNKALIYAATLSVFVDARPLPSVCLETDALEGKSTIYGGYAQSKWVAERLVRNSANAHILRFGLLTANQGTGFSPSQDSLTRLLLGEDQFPAPSTLEEGASLDFTPVDYAARVLVDILIEAPSPRTFHIANPRQLLAEDLYRAVSSSLFDLVTEPRRPSPNHQVSNIFKTTTTRFSMIHTEAAASTPCPRFSHDELVSLLNRMHDTLLTA